MFLRTLAGLVGHTREGRRGERRSGAETWVKLPFDPLALAEAARIRVEILTLA